MSSLPSSARFTKLKPAALALFPFGAQARLVETVCETLGFDGELVFDTSKPDGTPRKLLNIEKLRSLGWSPRIPLREGILDAYAWFLKSAR
jgi:nucleoside-diphosphate-sugar epimerase